MSNATLLRGKQYKFCRSSNLDFALLSIPDNLLQFFHINLSPFWKNASNLTNISNSKQARQAKPSIENSLVS